MPRGISAGPLCHAKAKGSGMQCRRNALPGMRVCRIHGGASPKAKEGALKRLALAEAFERGDRRPAWQILADALHAADTMMIDARIRLGEGEPITVEQLDRFTEALERAQRFAKVFLDAGVDERQTRIAESTALMLVGVIRAILDELDLSPAQRAKVGEVVPRHLRAITAA